MATIPQAIIGGEGMICPLKRLGLLTAQQPTKPEYCQCDEIDCAWWFTEKGGCCSLVAIANLLELARHGNFGG